MSYGVRIMLKVKKVKVPLEMTGTINYLTMKLQEEHEHNMELEDAIVELAELIEEKDNGENLL